MKTVLVLILISFSFVFAASPNFNAPAVGTPSTISETWEQIRTNECYSLKMDDSITVSNLPTGAICFNKLSASTGTLKYWNGSAFADFNQSFLGSVGIGKSAPSHRLDVQAAAGSDAVIKLYAGSGKTTALSLCGDATEYEVDSFDILQGSTGAFLLTRSKALSIGTNSVNRINIGATGMISCNYTGADADFQVKSDGNDNMLYVDAGNNRVGIGTASPSQALHVVGKQVISSSGSASLILSGASRTPLTDSFDIEQDSSYAYVWQRANLPIIIGTNNTERMRISSDGNVGIGTTAPLRAFVVSYAGTDGLEIDPSQSFEIISYDRTNNNYEPFKVAARDFEFNIGEVSAAMVIDANGDWFYNSCPAGTGNDIEITGGKLVENTSCRAGKENIRTAAIQPAKVLDVELVSYERKESGKTEWGAIAEDVAAVCPELCNYNDSGEVIGIRYKMIGALLIPVVKQQQQEIQELRQAISALERRLPKKEITE